MIEYEEVKKMVSGVRRVDYGGNPDINPLLSAKIVDQLFTQTGSNGATLRDSIVSVISCFPGYTSGDRGVLSRSTQAVLEDSGFSARPSVRILLDFGESSNPNNVHDIAVQLIDQARKWCHPFSTGLVRAIYQYPGIYQEILSIEPRLTQALTNLCDPSTLQRR